MATFKKSLKCVSYSLLVIAASGFEPLFYCITSFDGLVRQAKEACILRLLIFNLLCLITSLIN